MYRNTNNPYGKAIKQTQNLLSSGRACSSQARGTIKFAANYRIIPPFSLTH